MESPAPPPTLGSVTPLVSVVILNWNGGRRLIEAVESVLDQTHQPLELIVVDNGSSDGSLTQLPEDPRIQVIENGENLGYARGMNIGWHASTGALWIPMNDDARLHPRFVEAAIAAFEVAPEAGAVAPLVLRPRGPMLPWDERGPALLDSGPETVTLDMRVVTDGEPDRPTPAFKANGSCPVYRATAIDDVLDVVDAGPFDPWFDTYGEDTDLAFRLHALGWTTVFTPAVLAAHHTAASSSARIADKRGRLRQNVMVARHANAWRHLPVSRLVMAVPLILAGDVVFALRSLLRGDFSVLSDLGAAWRRVARSVGSFREERRRFPPSRHASAGRLRRVSRRDRWVTIPEPAS